MKTLTSMLAILALAANAYSAEGDAKKPGAGKAKKSPAEIFKAMDKNGDGSVSKEEFLASPGAKKDAAKAEERFGKMDKDKNGSLSKEEMTPKPKKDAK